MLRRTPPSLRLSMARRQTLQVRSNSLINLETSIQLLYYSVRQGFGEPDGASSIVFDDAQVSCIVSASDVK